MFSSASAPIATLKGYTEIVPEIVGGNGAIYYAYDVDGTVTGRNITTPLVTEGTIDYTLNTVKPITMQIGDLLKIGDGTSKPFTFTFWDSTEGTTSLKTAGTTGTPTSQSAAVTLYLGVNVAAAANPEVTIAPFHWAGADDNSLYGSSGANGHIELEADWAQADGYKSTDTSGEFDADPKVSGSIVLNGHVHDDKLINELYVSIPGMSFTGMETKAITYSDGNLTYYRVAHYKDGALVSDADTTWESAGFALAGVIDAAATKLH